MKKIIKFYLFLFTSTAIYVIIYEQYFKASKIKNHTLANLRKGEKMDSDDPNPDSITLHIVLCVILIILSAFFSATETAFSSVNKTKLRVKVQDGHKGAKNALALAEDFDRVLSTILVGNNLVNITLSSLCLIIFSNILQNNTNLAATVSTAVTTVLVLIFGEITPKMIAKEKSEGASIILGYPIKFFMIILWPITFVFSGLKLLLQKMFKLESEEKITEEELLTIVEEAQEDGALNESETQLISSSIEFDDVLVEDILVPRVGVIAVPLDMPMDRIKALFLEHNFSRMPVYKGTIDAIVGMIHNIDFFAALERGETNIKNAISPVAYATEHMKISTLLKNMQKQKVHMAIVVDEYGGTLGIATLEDILEELVGEIWDEHDEIINYFTKIDDLTYMVDGRAELDKFFTLFGLDGDDENFETQTVSGWVIEQTGTFPKKFESFDYKNLTIITNKLTQRRVLDVKVVINPVEDGDNKED